MQSKKFQKTLEDFDCQHCGTRVHGNGFTNHCPHCLWSKHVDINPGDRQAGCNSLMQPVGIEYKTPLRIIHRCSSCDFVRPCKVSDNDSQEALLALARATSGVASNHR